MLIDDGVALNGSGVDQVFTALVKSIYQSTLDRQKSSATETAKHEPQAENVRIESAEPPPKKCC